MPLYIVDHPDFRAFVDTLDPQFRLASKKRFLYNLLPNVYNRCFNYVKDEVAQVNTTSLGCESNFESDSESTTLTNGSNGGVATFAEQDIFAQIFEDEDDSPERLNCAIHDLQLVIKDSKKSLTNIEKCVETIAAAVASSVNLI